ESGELILFLADRSFPIYLGQGDMGKKCIRLARVLGWLYKKNEFQDTTSIRLEYLDNKVLVERGGSV
ncbi:MAG: cell division protein FtsQ, partial [Proteobacteria bacterium]|nr:cell division protein FtsQ [Pseudomonadota bacterium]